MPRKKFLLKIFGYGVIYEKICFSLISASACKKNVVACCGLNFDATDLPNRGLSIYYVVQIRGPERPLRGGLPTLCNIVKKEKGEIFGDKRRWKTRKIFGLDEKKNREGKRGKYVMKGK